MRYSCSRPQQLHLASNTFNDSGRTSDGTTSTCVEYGTLPSSALFSNNAKNLEDRAMAQATAHPDRRLISSEDVQGTNVYGIGDEAIGEIECLSACTLVLSTIPRNRICVTRRALLGFHAPMVVDRKSGRSFRSRDATRAVDASYPAAVRTWDQAQRRLEAKVHLSSGTRARSTVPALLVRAKTSKKGIVCAGFCGIM